MKQHMLTHKTRGEKPEGRDNYSYDDSNSNTSAMSPAKSEAEPASPAQSNKSMEMSPGAAKPDVPGHFSSVSTPSGTPVGPSQPATTTSPSMTSPASAPMTSPPGQASGPSAPSAPASSSTPAPPPPLTSSSSTGGLSSSSSHSSHNDDEGSPFVKRPNLRHVCNVCSKPFSSSSALQIHSRYGHFCILYTCTFVYLFLRKP